MKTANLANEALRDAETGQVWEEKLSGATGTVNVPRFATFRVRATGATTVTIGGVLAMTMSSGEIAIFNAGYGDPSVDTNVITGANPSGTQTITVPIVIGAAAAFMQVARDNKRTV